MNDAVYWLTLTFAILGAWETYGFRVSLVIDQRPGHGPSLMAMSTAEFRFQAIEPGRPAVRRLSPVMVVIG
jgi:hypothetical protein